MLAPSIRTSIRCLRKPTSRRSFYSKLAEFVTIDAHGSLVTRTVSVWLGDPHEAFVLIPTDIGNAIKAGCAQQSLVTDPQICPLKFYHDLRYFVHESTPYPRLLIPQDLPRQSDANTSLATLYLFGATHTIALDGTADADFARKSRDTLRQMKPVLDYLKDR